mmetsp:Transcript_56761/g.112877  ORF Transcript_56761/g.112877 Transcript_56761/m.112877 type:complete len:703 (-) Transcript_56761:112-2220(-)
MMHASCLSPARRTALAPPVSSGCSAMLLQPSRQPVWTPRRGGSPLGVTLTPRLDEQGGRPPPSTVAVGLGRPVGGGATRSCIGAAPPSTWTLSGRSCSTTSADDRQARKGDRGSSVAVCAASAPHCRPARSASCSNMRQPSPGCHSFSNLHEPLVHARLGQHAAANMFSPPRVRTSSVDARRPSYAEHLRPTAHRHGMSPREPKVHKPVLWMPGAAAPGFMSARTTPLEPPKRASTAGHSQTLGNQPSLGLSVRQLSMRQVESCRTTLHGVSVTADAPSVNVGNTSMQEDGSMQTPLGILPYQGNVSTSFMDQATEASPFEPDPEREGVDARMAFGEDSEGDPTTPCTPWAPQFQKADNKDYEEKGTPEMEVQTRRKVATPKSQKPRFQHLYQDFENRQRRLQERFEEKRRQEDDALQRQLQATASQRTFDPGAFLDWYDSHLDRYQVQETRRKELQRTEAQRRASEELAECSFSPQGQKATSSSKRNSICSRRGTTQTSRNSVKEDAGTDELLGAVHQLVAEQALQVETLRKFDRQDQEQEAEAELVVARDLEGAIEESRRKVQRFMETPDGREYLTERANSYMKLNPGIDRNTALREAQDDLIRASEAKLRSQFAETVRNRSQSDSQNLMMERLKVVRELIQLQRACQNLIGRRGVPHEALQGFDMQLVDRLTSEPWYAKARETAKRILSARAVSPGSRS